MADSELHLTPGTLWPALLERTEHARASGALHMLQSTMDVIDQDKIPFQVRVVESLNKKATSETASVTANPFLPYDSDLFVAPISPTHVALLNKFNVVDHHLLIVTRVFEDQRSQLTQKDCEALLIALTEIEGLGFYNAGSEAGASQSHKHLQLVPLEAIDPIPIDALMPFARMDDLVGTVPRLPFRHAYAPMDADWTNPQKMSGASFHARYRALLRSLGLPVDATVGSRATTAPYNLLVTRKWMLMVPRVHESYEGISINALAFAGALLVKDPKQLAILRRVGPIAALTHVTGTPSS